MRRSVLSAVLVLLLPAGLSAQARDRTGPLPRLWEESEQLLKQLDTTIEYPGIDSKVKVTLIDELDRLSAKHNLTIDFNGQAFRDEQVNDVLGVDLAKEGVRPLKAPLGLVLRKLLSRVPCRSDAIYVVKGDTIEITTRAARLKELGLPPDTTSPLVKKQFRKAKLGDALHDLDAHVVIDLRVAAQTQVQISTRFYYVPVETAVELLADTGGLAVVPREDVFYVTSPRNAARMRAALAARPGGESGGPTPRVYFSTFNPKKRSELTLRKALERIAEEASLNLLIDPRVEKDLTVPLTLRADVPHAPTGLELLADMAGLAVVKRANVYYVTMPDNADRIRRDEPRSRMPDSPDAAR
jgi:hypothetical protein